MVKAEDGRRQMEEPPAREVVQIVGHDIIPRGLPTWQDWHRSFFPTCCVEETLGDAAQVEQTLQRLLGMLMKLHRDACTMGRRFSRALGQFTGRQSLAGKRQMSSWRGVVTDEAVKAIRKMERNLDRRDEVSFRGRCKSIKCLFRHLTSAKKACQGRANWQLGKDAQPSRYCSPLPNRE